MADANVDLGLFVAIGPKLAQAAQLSTRQAVNRVAFAITNEARRQVVRAVGANQTLGGMPGSKKIQPYYRKAMSEIVPMAVVSVSGPWQLVEHPRQGGYTIRPKSKKALTVGAEGMMVGGATGGPIAAPLRPIGRTFARAAIIADRVAAEAVDEAMRRQLDKVA